LIKRESKEPNSKILDHNNSVEIVKLIQYSKTREKGFKLLMQSYKEALYWMIRRMVLHHDDAEDVLQCSFMKIWQNLDKFRGDANIYTWVYRIAVNEALAFLNKKKKQSLSLNEKGEYLSQQLESDSYFDGDDAQKQLQLALKTLPSQQRVVFNLRYFEEMKYQDMAKVLDKSEGGLKANYHHAVKKIEEYFKKN